MTLDFTLDPLEARVLGVLIEKELTTPDQYPLTLNALTLGSNQKSNRDPVIELSESETRSAIERLRRHGLVGASHASGARVERYRHAAASVLGLEKPELALLAELLLRGAQTPGELRGRASRMHPFETLESLDAVLGALAAKGLAIRLHPPPGSRAVSWDQLLAARGTAPVPVPASSAPAEREDASPDSALPVGGGLEARVAALERETARLAELCEELARERRGPAPG